MERVLERYSGTGFIYAAFAIGAAVFALAVIAYGADGVVPGVHDAFHDFRHVIGMPCH